MGYVASVVLIGLVVLGVFGTVRWAKGQSAQGEVPLVLFDLAVGGMAVLLITSWLDAAKGPDVGGGDVSVLAWSIAAAASVGVGMTAVRRRAAAST